MKCKNNSLLFVCSPSLALLDNWLPVIWAIKQKNPSINLIFYSPIARTIDEIDLGNVLIKISREIFDEIIYIDHSGFLLSANSFEEAKRINNRNFIQKIARRALGLLGFKNDKLLFILNSIIFPSHRKSHFLWSSLKGKCLGILYDTGIEKNKMILLDLNKQMKTEPRFSICHGFNVSSKVTTNREDQRKNRIDTHSIRNNVIAYLFSPYELNKYRNIYEIPDKNIKVVGIPRHQSFWINLIISRSNPLPTGFDKDFVFIISRPSVVAHSPRDKKKQSLRDIQKIVVEELGKRLVIKLHPKERPDGLCEEVFGSENYGKTWIYSNAHPFVLGKKSLFAVAFHSSVVIDMVALGVPVIEHLDMRGVPLYDSNEGLRNSKGEPVSTYRYMGLVLSATNEKEMRRQVAKIISNRQYVVEMLLSRYHDTFPVLNSVNQSLADDICSVINVN